MSLERKSCVLDSLDFFPKIVWEIRSQEIKSWRKYIRRKKNTRNKVLYLVKMRSSLKRFHKKRLFLCICTLNIAIWVFFYINCPFFCMVVNILCSHAFSTSIGLFFQGCFFINSYWTQKKSEKIKSRIGRTLFPKTF